MTTPTTLPEALTEIEGLRGQVRELIRLMGQDGQGKTGAADQAEDSPVDHPQRRDTFLREIVEGTAAATGTEFFRSLVHHLAKALTVRCAFIGEWYEDRPDTIHMLAVWSGTAFGEPFDYKLRGTPCINVVGREVCFYGNGVRQRFPEDRLLAEMGIDSYCGIPLFGQSANPLGLLVVMDDRPMTNTTVVRDLLTIFAFRAAAELERSRAEQERTQALADLHNVMETIPDVVFTLDLVGNLARWNRALERVTGYSANELLNKHALEFVPPAEHEPTASAIQRAFRDGYAELEGHVLTKDGRTIPYHWTGATLTDHQGHMIGLTGVGRDISDRKQTESALRQSEAQFRALIEHSSDITTVLDLEGRIRFESPSFERLLGYAQHELDGLIASDFIHPNDLPTVLEKFQLVVQRPGEAQTAEFRFRHKDGSWMILEGIGRSILNAEGRRCVIVNSRDVTERQRVVDTLAQRSLQQQVIAEFGEFALRDRTVQSVMDQAVQRIAQTLHTEYCKVLELQPGGTS
ncbi:MAG: PAS domain S-box protein, partial [Nitrospira sp.]|nr:PAS domain S-box protein [Nitrospira sp.]